MGNVPGRQGQGTIRPDHVPRGSTDGITDRQAAGRACGVSVRRRGGGSAQVCGFHPIAIRGERGGRPATHYLAMDKDNCLVRYLQRELDVLFDQDYDHPGLIRDATDHWKQPFDDHRETDVVPAR